MTCDEQLTEWVKGNPIHNDERGECCPDFSCCQPHLLASERERIVFRDADETTRNSMLMMFLGAACASMGKSVHIAGDADLASA